ncbi:cell division protein CrgA [Spongisporangium articulatum]|uniref:Cell division protein CrgA n=1 Tax=Spongisporangium articulatum TaxID=3362603 RepID=A0ABW8AI51_9ACTN
MPESKSRDKGSYTAPTAKSGVVKPNPRWFAPVMVGFLVLGLAWVVTYYVSQAKYPIPDGGNWNLMAGFGVLLVGFAMLTRWR